MSAKSVAKWCALAFWWRYGSKSKLACGSEAAELARSWNVHCRQAIGLRTRMAFPGKAAERWLYMFLCGKERRKAGRKEGNATLREADELWLYWVQFHSFKSLTDEHDCFSSRELRGCVKVEVAVLGSPSLISLMVSVDVKHHQKKKTAPELRICVKVEVAVLGSRP